MKIKEVQVQEFMTYFSGSLHNYGEHTYEKGDQTGTKKVGSSKTIREKLITIQEYERHLAGEKGLGIIPISETSKCRFSVIDVDLYDVDYELYLRAIEQYRFPIVPFRSKSGGLHLYTFYIEEVSPSLAIAAMKQMAFLLSIDILVKSKKNTPVEIFPKQTKIKPGDTGNWINLPYYDAAKTKSPALKGGKDLTLSEALAHIRDKRVKMSDVQAFLGEVELSDAPPCLQTLNILNPFGEGSGRNNYLFSFGVYLKKKDESDWEFKLKEVNNNLAKPVPESELEHTVIASLKRKDYLYKCLDTPCVSACNRKECEKREYGIGKEGGYFNAIEYGQLTQVQLDEPYYLWEVRLQGQEGYTELQFSSEDEIIKQDVFLRLCMRKLHELPVKLKQLEWFNKVNQALKDLRVQKVEHGDDTSPIVLFRAHIHEFLTDRALADTKDQVMSKRVYFDQKTSSYWFRSADIMSFLEQQKRFFHFGSGELHKRLRKDMNAESITIRTESGLKVRVWSVPKHAIDSEQRIEFVPKFEEAPKEDF